MQPIYVIGMGLGPEDITPAMAEIIAKAQVLAGGRRLLDWFAAHKAERLKLSGDIGAWLEDVAKAANTKQVVVLASGDPGFFGVAGAVVKRLGRDNVIVMLTSAPCRRPAPGWACNGARRPMSPCTPRPKKAWAPFGGPWPFTTWSACTPGPAWTPPISRRSSMNGAWAAGA